MNKPKVSVVIPTYNEAESIHAVVRAIAEQLKEYTFEILVVDDNSPDGTLEVALREKISGLRGIRRESDHGFAKSIRRGLEEAQGEWIVIMDSDFNHDPTLLPMMLANLHHFDCVVASRFLYGGLGANRNRHLLSWAFNIFLRLLIDGRITDNLFGYFAIHRSHLRTMNFDKVFWGFGDYAIRFLYYLQRSGLSILQVPAVLKPRRGGQGNQRLIKTFFIYTFSALKLVWKEGRLKIEKFPEDQVRKNDLDRGLGS